ncbi:glycosyltransferase family 4 protein [Aeromonas hydrophila]|uniref:glycosyltransferase family 4 protein n=1 Tax=Aeromonas hydrophila TaxID=644 RepID=UPI001A92AC14|nr:glycosyltransferase family 1 protein [Aeromonas hydrophila]MBO0408684.1 glycosyltransferase family 4 protein [Aeromonas hydrophila]
MKLVIDGIIESLQNNGGCTVYFNQFLSFLQKDKKNLLIFMRFFPVMGENIELDAENSTLITHKQRFLERWRDVDTSLLGDDIIFHSTHYRLPTCRVKTVTTVHDFTYELYRKGPARWMHSWQKFRAIRSSDLVICVSQNTADDLMRFCPIDRDKIRIVYNGVSESYFPIDGIDKSNSVVFVGARGWYKNFVLAVRTLQYFPYLNLSIVGGGALTPEEAALLEEYIPGRYEWLGRVTDSGLNELYNKAYCLFYPSSYEGFGIPVAEAMRSGCPVVAVNTSSIPEVAGDAALLVKEATVDAFKDAFTQLESESIRKKLIIDGLLQAKKFSWKKCYQDTLRVYHELME